MKSYLNQEERRKIAIMCCAGIGVVGGELEENKDNYSKKEITCLKYVKTYMEKLLTPLFERVGADEGRRIKQLLNESIINLKPKLSKSDSYVVDKESLEGICNEAVYGRCSHCTIQDNYDQPDI